jgi:ribosomal protein S18 acetylase RimI-like enzyme
VLRQAPENDADFVRSLSREVFARFGAYDRLLPRLLRAASVATFVAEIGGEPAGFAMVDPRGGPDGEGELIAIAVEPGRQRRGVGRALLDRAEMFLRERTARNPRRGLWLTVAEDNAVARRLFEQCGYRIVDADHGRYDGGQRSIAMRKSIDPA